jgi:4-phospho-D-threonate 3-dehydrogenase / 4-phospho-D-erythronate 3-dehydrogenase
MERPVIALTLGDPAGIGPEIVVKALSENACHAVSKPLVYGDSSIISKALERFTPGTLMRVIKEPGEIQGRQGVVEVVDVNVLGSMDVVPGLVSAPCGKAAFAYIEAAVKDALDGTVGGIATAPINKEAIQAAKVPFIGHTEMLAGLCGVDDPLTMFETLGLRVFFLSRHVSLRKACDLVTSERLLDYLERCHAALERLGLGGGTIAVAGLNPHCGEHGLFGDEEGREVEPAIAAAQAKGLAVVGPVGADSVFHQAKIGRFAAVLSLYHDQGHIATKTLDFDRTISLTIGLPFLRTSVDHGTAFDIAWSGKASHVSMVESILVAAKYAPLYRRR